MQGGATSVTGTGPTPKPKQLPCRIRSEIGMTGSGHGSQFTPSKAPGNWNGLDMELLFVY